MNPLEKIRKSLYEKLTNLLKSAEAPAPEKKKAELPQWMGKKIVHPDHIQHLEQAAAINEFHHKMPREHAETKAHNDYRLEQHTIAAAHHLQGAKAAQGAGDMESARKHGAMYEMHVRQLGHEPVGPVPDVVRAHLDNPERTSIYKFKPHKSDIFLGED